MNYHVTSFLDYELFSGQLSDLLDGKKKLVNTLNQYSYCIAEEDAQYKNALINSEVVLPDGVGITMATWLIAGKKINKIAGADLHKFLLTHLEETGGKCFYLGSSQNTLDQIKARLEDEYPNVKAGFYSPPYKPVFSEEDSAAMIQAANDFEPDVLFVGMTAPKQEKWAYQFHQNLNATITCSIGAVFDFYAGTVQRPGMIFQKLGLEWFGRFIKEPKRLWRRYFYYGPIYVWMILREKLRLMLGIRKK